MRKLACLAMAAMAVAQGPQLGPDELTTSAWPFMPAPTFAAHTNLVEVPVVVRDSYEHAMDGLARDAFSLTVDGKPEPISGFTVLHAPGSAAAGAVTPHAVAWYFDDLEASLDDVGFARGAARKLLAEGMQPGERLAIYSGSGQAPLALTGDLAAAQAVLADLQPQHVVFTGPDEKPKLILTDLLTIVHYLCQQPGERTLVISSSSFNTIHFPALVEEITNTALACHVRVAPLAAPAAENDASALAKNLAPQPMSAGRLVHNDGPQPSRDDREEITVNSGGRFFSRNNDVLSAFRMDSLAPEVSYVLSFTPTDVAADGAFHTLRVALQHEGTFSLQAREGFMAPEPLAAAAGLGAQDFLRQALASETPRADFAARAVLSSHPPPAGAALAEVAVDFTIAAAALPWAKLHGHAQEKLALVVELLDTQGRFVVGEEGEMGLNLKAKTLTAVSLPGAGLHDRLAMRVTPGAYQMRTVVMDETQRRIATQTQTVEIPGGAQR